MTDLHDEIDTLAYSIESGIQKNAEILENTHDPDPKYRRMQEASPPDVESLFSAEALQR